MSVLQASSPKAHSFEHVFDAAGQRFDRRDRRFHSPSPSSTRTTCGSTPNTWISSCVSAQGGFCSNEILEKAKGFLEELCDHHKIDESHGFGHALRVLAHAERALHGATFELTANRCLAVRLAALLHDADDKKYFNSGLEAEYPNARGIAEMAGVPARVVDDIIYMISLVSTSSNGNTIPDRAIAEPEVLWPRWADRLEAIGERGVVRCWQYSYEVKRPLFDSCTPRPTCAEEVWAEATPEKLDAYRSKLVMSKTMLDHYYLVLLSVARPPLHSLQSPYLEAEFAKGAAPLVEMCLVFGATGKIDEERIQKMCIKLDGEVEQVVLKGMGGLCMKHSPGNGRHPTITSPQKDRSTNADEY